MNESCLRRADRVILNVGGAVFETSVSTLCSGSAYFAAQFSRWDEMEGEREVFLDRDGDAFAIVLSFLRSGVVALPEHDLGLSARAIAEALLAETQTHRTLHTHTHTHTPL